MPVAHSYLRPAAQLGRNVADQLGRGLEDAEYRGDPGLCPLCHLDVIALHGRDVECATCGARGVLDKDGGVRWTDLSTSVITMHERQAHAVEIQKTARRHAGLADEIERRSATLGRSTPVRPRD